MVFYTKKGETFLKNFEKLCGASIIFPLSRRITDTKVKGRFFDKRSFFFKICNSNPDNSENVF